MELLTYLPLGLIIDVSTCMDNITFKIRLQYGSYQLKLLHMHDSSRVLLMMPALNITRPATKCPSVHVLTWSQIWFHLLVFLHNAC